jgi:hypothetical protein
MQRGTLIGNNSAYVVFAALSTILMILSVLIEQGAFGWGGAWPPDLNPYVPVLIMVGFFAMPLVYVGPISRWMLAVAVLSLAIFSLDMYPSGRTVLDVSAESRMRFEQMTKASEFIWLMAIVPMALSVGCLFAPYTWGR